MLLEIFALHACKCTKSVRSNGLRLAGLGDEWLDGDAARSRAAD